MNKIIRTSLFAITLIAMTTVTTFAQNLKFGHINSAELISKMPGIKEAEAKLQAEQKSVEQQYSTMMQEYQSKVQEYQQAGSTLTGAVKEMKEREILDLEKRIQTFQSTIQEDLAKKKEELYSPILKKAEEAIKAVAKEKGYAYVFDTSVGAVLYAQDSDNIMGLVTAKLGL